MKTRITTSAYNEMIKTVGSQPAESGGLLFGSRKDWVVTKFLFDKNAKTTSTTYSFNVVYLNPMIEKLGNEGLQLLGFFHSHPQGYKQLSEPDREYFFRQFNNIPVDKFLTPLMFPATDGSYDFIPYVYHKDGTVERTELDILPDDYATYVVSDIEDTTVKYVLPVPERKQFTFRSYFFFLLCILGTGVLAFTLAVLYTVYNKFETLLNLSL